MHNLKNQLEGGAALASTTEGGNALKRPDCEAIACLARPIALPSSHIHLSSPHDRDWIACLVRTIACLARTIAIALYDILYIWILVTCDVVGHLRCRTS
jgi:hypothetical protein